LNIHVFLLKKSSGSADSLKVTQITPLTYNIRINSVFKGELYMNKIILEALLYFFACIGIYTIIAKIVKSIIYRGKHWFDNVTVILNVKGREDGMEYILRSLVSYTDMITDGRGCPEIVVIDNGMEPETAAVCNKFNKIKVCNTAEAIQGIIQP